MIYEEFEGKAVQAVLRIRRVADGKHLFVDELKPRTVAFDEAVNFSPDGKSVVIGELDGFKVFDLETEKPLYVSPSFKPSDSEWKSLPLREARFSADGSSVVYRQETDLRRWNVAERRFLPVFAWKGELKQVSMSRDAHRMTCNYQTGDAAPDEGTAMFDLDSGKCVWKWSRHLNLGKRSFVGRRQTRIGERHRSPEHLCNRLWRMTVTFVWLGLAGMRHLPQNPTGALLTVKNPEFLL